MIPPEHELLALTQQPCPSMSQWCVQCQDAHLTCVTSIFLAKSSVLPLRCPCQALPDSKQYWQPCSNIIGAFQLERNGSTDEPLSVSVRWDSKSYPLACSLY